MVSDTDQVRRRAVNWRRWLKIGAPVAGAAGGWLLSWVSVCSGST